MSLIHHYTSIETLALILSSGNIRFNRLDNVDDQEERQLFDSIDFSKYLFVSCWTDNDKESIPQWNMYGDEMRGVRISMDKSLFETYEIEDTDYKGIHFSGSKKSLFRIEDVITNTYSILGIPSSQKGFLRKIKYVEDLDTIYGDYAEIIQSQDSSKYNIDISKYNDFATYKSIDWKFQNEIRFVFTILPGVPLEPSETYGERYSNNLIKALVEGNPAPMNYYDKKIDNKALDNIIVTLGPMCTVADNLIVENLLSQYSSHGKIKESKFSGKIQERGHNAK